MKVESINEKLYCLECQHEAQPITRVHFGRGWSLNLCGFCAEELTLEINKNSQASYIFGV